MPIEMPIARTPRSRPRKKEGPRNASDQSLLKRERGVALAEYVLLLAGLIFIISGAVAGFSSIIENKAQNIVAALGGGTVSTTTDGSGQPPPNYIPDWRTANGASGSTGGSSNGGGKK